MTTGHQYIVLNILEDGWMDERVGDGLVDGWMGGWVDGCIHIHKYACTVCTYGWMEGWMDGLIEG